jgi:hypothetical protein
MDPVCSTFERLHQMKQLARALTILALTFSFVNPLLAEDVGSPATTSTTLAELQKNLAYLPLGLIDWALRVECDFEDYYRPAVWAGHHGLARPRAMGSLLIKRDEGLGFAFWFLWQNSEGYVQVCMSRPLELAEVAHIFQVHDLEGDTYRAMSVSDECGGGGWIGTTLDFTDGSEVVPENDEEFVSFFWERMQAQVPFLTGIHIHTLLR